MLTAVLVGGNTSLGLAENTDDLFIGKCLLIGMFLCYL